MAVGTIMIAALCVPGAVTSPDPVAVTCRCKGPNQEKRPAEGISFQLPWVQTTEPHPIPCLSEEFGLVQKRDLLSRVAGISAKANLFFCTPTELIRSARRYRLRLPGQLTVLQRPEELVAALRPGSGKLFSG
jgi:hypothetical protein